MIPGTVKKTHEKERKCTTHSVKITEHHTILHINTIYKRRTKL